MSQFIKVPLNLEGVNYKDLRSYIKYLDCKAQTPEGIFKIYCSKRYYYRTINMLIVRGWASICLETENGRISLRAYQYVWRSMGVDQMIFKGRNSFRFYKIELERLADDRKTYLKQIEEIIRQKMAKRRAAQIRWNLLKAGQETDQANFSAKSAALLFGYRSPSTGSKLREKHFDLIPSESKPYFDRIEGRFKEPCKRIAL